MKYIKLTNNKYAVVDDEDFDRVNQFKWYFDDGYARRSNHINKRKTRAVLMHRIIMDCPKDKQIDHINRNRSDNRKCNLRICDQNINTKNNSLYKNNNSGISGIYWNKLERKWKVSINIDNNKRIHLGTYNDFNYAKNKRYEAEKIYWTK